MSAEAFFSLVALYHAAEQIPALLAENEETVMERATKVVINAFQPELLQPVPPSEKTRAKLDAAKKPKARRRPRR